MDIGVTGDYQDMDSAANNVNRSETGSVAVTGQCPVNDKPKRGNNRVGRPRGRGGVSRGRRKTIMMAKRSELSILAAAKEVLQESTVTSSVVKESNVVKILKKRKKKKIKRLFTIRKKHTTQGLKSCTGKKLAPKEEKEPGEGSGSQLSASQTSTESEMSRAARPKTVESETGAVTTDRPSEMTEETRVKKVKRKYHWRMLKKLAEGKTKNPLAAAGLGGEYIIKYKFYFEQNY